MSHAGPTPPELEPPLEPELPLDPELPLEPELPLDPELPLEPVSALAPLSSVTGALFVDGGSFGPVGSGSAAFVSWMSAPSPSSGEVAHAATRATSDRAPAMRVERLMASTLAAELCMALACLSRETLR